jgi:hypothetical protein
VSYYVFSCVAVFFCSFWWIFCGVLFYPDLRHGEHFPIMSRVLEENQVEEHLEIHHLMMTLILAMVAETLVRYAEVSRGNGLLELLHQDLLRV